MAVAVAINSVDFTGNELIVSGTLALTGNYGGGATHGDTLGFLGHDEVKSSYPPTKVDIYEAPPAGTSAAGNTFNFSPGTTQGNGVMQVFAAGTEYTEGSAYSPGLLAAVLKFSARFPSL